MSSVRSKSEHKHGGEEEEEERERPKPLPLPEPLDGGRPGLDNRASLEYVVMSLHRTATGTRTHARASARSLSVQEASTLGVLRFPRSWRWRGKAELGLGIRPGCLDSSAANFKVSDSADGIGTLK